MDINEQKYHNLKLGERGAMISIIAYIFLSILKLAIGYMTDSAALRADGLNNTTDIIASIAVLVGLRISRRPADENHRYGHWKSETIASMIASFIMLAVGIQVLNETIGSIFREEQTSPNIGAAYIGVFAAIIMYFVYRYNKNLAEKINSKAVLAAAKDNLSDAWVSIGIAIGILGSQLHMPWLDTVAAFLVGLLICKTAWEIFRQASHELSDGFDEAKIALYGQVIKEVAGVEGIKELKGRNYGNNEAVDVVILVNDTLNIKEAHDIATLVEQVLVEDYQVYSVSVHVEPN